MPGVKTISVAYAALSGLAVLYAAGSLVYVGLNRSSGGFINLHLEEIVGFVGMGILAAVAGLGLLGCCAGAAAALLVEEQRELLGWWLALGGLFTTELLAAGIGYILVPAV